MITGPRWLSLEVSDREKARSFYRRVLDLPLVRYSDDQSVLRAGDTELRLRRPGSESPGGRHVHYALAVAPDAYESWYSALDEDFDLVEHRFGDARSLYFFDLDDNCIELGERPVADGDLGDVFEIVLEVAELARSEAFYADLGFEVVDRGTDRPRVRLTAGDLDLELWEPHRGIADARGGAHVDFGVAETDPDATASAVADVARSITSVEDGVRLQDPDDHHLTLCRED